ncbi:TetR/AcrR family transcriptional regulator [Maridesulfovibrio hydrothermalis]|uniref:Transcriptional regulator, TetR family n=1 Tax=Maridesulfovibrio hydrothermalis AM13 = DSM 14728 TaxID=1121451 RepID=L0RFN1_9BACT|nr:TetR/AcrR family transcriptional regulator [Maridesulfovibrio hydrothermalis]CCO25000.1 Transcriptional regulator, TetR family [Maridesulfovibrio hydrothermalis AM13 = DSM 14728]
MSKRMDRISRREQIAEEALKLAAKGISSITMDKVSKACGIVPSALYRHYKNKDEILDGLRDLVRNKLLENAKLATAEENSPLSALKNLALRHADLLYNHPGIPRLLFSEAALEKNSIRRKTMLTVMNEYRSAAARIAGKGQELGEIRKDVTPEDVVFMLLGTVVPPSFLFHISNGEFDPRVQVKRNLVLFEEAVKFRNEDE